MRGIAALLIVCPMICQAPVRGADWGTIPREFRGVWIATVENIDWPSRPGLPVPAQQAELVKLLDLAQSLRLNAVILQVRPCADAFYPSPLEPWSEYLSGVMGQGPSPNYDPLQFAIEEAHARGLELHAWLNPFRARHASSQRPLAKTHVATQHPEWVRGYGKYLWLDPGVPEASAHSLAVIGDIVDRYDVDAIHFDDYFYPYPIADTPFPDDGPWTAAQQAGAEGDRDAWRRKNVDDFIRDAAQVIRARKPWVRFGISPFGIWRPGHPAGIQGFDPFTQLHADAKKWLQSGWIDYLAPQLYWPIDQRAQSFPLLLQWWQEQNTRQRHLWPGLFTSRLREDAAKGWRSEEITQQIQITRAMLPEGMAGHMHFSARALAGNSAGIAEALRAGLYQNSALVPSTPWLAAPNWNAPPRVRVQYENARLSLILEPPEDPVPWLWVVQFRLAGDEQLAILPGRTAVWECSQEVPSGASWEARVTVVNPIGQLSPAAELAADAAPREDSAQ